jgi:hypothetical protein
MVRTWKGSLAPRNIVEEIDRSDELLGMIRKEKTDAVISAGAPPR